MTIDFRFIHCADLHLGSRFKGVSSDDPELGRRMFAAPLEAFRRLVDAASSRGASFIVVSGDVYDDGCTLPTTRMAFAEELGRAGMPVYICRGNHDHSQPWDDAIPYPPNVVEFGTEPSVESPLPGVEVAGVSFSGDHEVRNLVSMISGTPGRFTVGCVHCDVDPSPGGLPYAPCTSSNLVGRGVDYWALGHIHARRVLMEEPFAVYPGNIQGRNPRESGDKGAYLVEVRDSRVHSMEFLPLQSFAWRDVELDVAGMSLDGVIDSVMSVTVPGDMVRLMLRGSGPLDRLIRSEGGQFANLVSRRTGCGIVSVDHDPGTAVPEGDRLASSVVSAAEAMVSQGREGILTVLRANKALRPHMGFFESMDDDELTGLVGRARSMLLDDMGVGP